jgi:hypothetical protein
MRVRRPWLFLLVLLVPGIARADDHKADVMAALSYGNGSTTWGPHVSAACVLPVLDRRLSVLGDMSSHFGSDDGNDADRVAMMGGFRFTATKPGTYSEHQPFGHVLLGAVHSHEGGEDTDFAVAFGGGYEFVPNRAAKSSGATPGHEGVAFRVQLDYLAGAGFFRFSGGVVYRFKRDH